MPDAFTYRTADQFDSVGSALQIFTSSMIECDGYLQSWRFIPQNTVFVGLHLAIFRTVRNHFYVANETKVTMSLTQIRQYPDGKEGKFERDEWMELIVPDPIAVKEGDMLGIYYDSFYSVRETLAIKTREAHAIGNSIGPTLIFLEDDSTMFIEDTGCYARKLLDGRDSIVVFREPALTAVITKERSNYEPKAVGDMKMAAYILDPAGELPPPSGVSVRTRYPMNFDSSFLSYKRNKGLPGFPLPQYFPSQQPPSSSSSSSPSSNPANFPMPSFGNPVYSPNAIPQFSPINRRPQEGSKYYKQIRFNNNNLNFLPTHPFNPYHYRGFDVMKRKPQKDKLRNDGTYDVAIWNFDLPPSIPRLNLKPKSSGATSSFDLPPPLLEDENDLPPPLPEHLQKEDYVRKLKNYAKYANF